MHKPGRMEQRMGGSEFQIGDCRVWAEILYLDSASDYRECLQEPYREQAQTSPGILVMLDDQRRMSFWVTPARKLVHALSRLRHRITHVPRW